jgi:Phage tail assembly chaperone protein, TAC
MGFFEKGLEALISSPGDLDQIERMLFRSHVSLLNEQGSWVPLGKELTESHFSGRLPAYFAILIKSIGYNFEDFLGGGWITSPDAATDE